MMTKLVSSLILAGALAAPIAASAFVLGSTTPGHTDYSPELVFEPADAGRHTALGQPERGGRCRETGEFGDAGEDANGLDVHARLCSVDEQCNRCGPVYLTIVRA